MDRLIPIVFRKLRERPDCSLDSRIVEGEIQAAKAVDRGSNKRLNIICPGYIGATKERISPCLPHQLNRTFTFRRPASRHDDRCTSFGKCQHCRTTDTGTSTCHQRYSVVQPYHATPLARSPADRHVGANSEANASKVRGSW